MYYKRVRSRKLAAYAERRAASPPRVCAWEGCDRESVTSRHRYCGEHRVAATDARLQRRGEMSLWRLMLARELDARRDARRKARGEDAVRRQRYGRHHQREREQWDPVVATGTVRCADPECLFPDEDGRPGLILGEWDLGHAPDGSHRGPEHRRCNRATARKKRAA